ADTPAMRGDAERQQRQDREQSYEEDAAWGTHGGVACSYPRYPVERNAKDVPGAPAVRTAITHVEGLPATLFSPPTAAKRSRYAGARARRAAPPRASSSSHRSARRSSGRRDRTVDRGAACRRGAP